MSQARTLSVEDPEDDQEEVKGSPQVQIRRKSVEREVNQHQAVQGHLLAQCRGEDIFQYCLLLTDCSSLKELVHHLFSPLGGDPRDLRLPGEQCRGIAADQAQDGKETRL